MHIFWKRLKGAVSRDRYAYGLIALGLLVQLFLITRPFDFLLTNLLPDDAFYYFQIARNIVHGSGSTFDGFHPTNGYHPLWMVILLPIFSFFSFGGVADTLPIYVSLGVLVLLNTVTACVLLRILRRITENEPARVFALMLWTLSPFVIFEILNGLETSLTLMLFSIFILSALRVSERDSKAGYLVVAIVGGLMVLARIDMVFYLAAFYLWLLVRHGLMGGLRRAIPAGIVSTLVIVPWFIWNLLVFHMLITSASDGNVLVNHTLIIQDHGTSLFQAVKAFFYSLVFYGSDVLLRTGASWLLFVTLGLAFALSVLGRLNLPKRIREVSLTTALFVGFVALFVANAGIRFTGRTWYFISFDIFLVLLVAWVFGALLPLLKQQWRVVGALSLVVLITFFLGWYGTLRDANTNQRTIYAMAQWMNEHLAPGTRVGVFNAGVQGYFSDMTVINLDGLVNNSAYEAMREGKLWSYIQDEHISYISDFPLYLSYRYHSFLDTPDVFAELTQVKTLQSSVSVHGSSDLILWAVKPSGTGEGM